MGTAAAVGTGWHNQAGKEWWTEIQQETVEKTTTHGSLEGRRLRGMDKGKRKEKLVTAFLLLQMNLLNKLNYYDGLCGSSRLYFLSCASWAWLQTSYQMCYLDIEMWYSPLLPCFSWPLAFTLSASHPSLFPLVPSREWSVLTLKILGSGPSKFNGSLKVLSYLFCIFFTM